MPNVTIVGPSRTDKDGKPGAALWTTRAKLVGVGGGEYASRNLFFDSVPQIFQQPAGTPNQRQYPMLLPGTMALQCTITSVAIDGVDCAANPADLTVTLVVTAGSEDWFRDDDHSTLWIPEPMTLVAGEIPVQLPAGDNLVSKLPMIRNPQNLRVNASGLCFDGQALFEWENAEVDQSSRFQLEFPFGTDQSLYRVLLDRGTVSEPAKRSFRDSFYRLQSIVSSQNGPVWATIELASKSDIPQFYWTSSADGEWELGLGQGEVSVALADRKIDDPDRNTATMVPPVRIDRNGQTLTVYIGDTQSQHATPQWNYQWTPERELVKIDDIDAIFDPTAVAAILRRIQQFADPVVGTPISPANPMLLWGFQPLEDGLAQLPFFNLTQQIVFDLIPPLTPDLSSEPAPSLIVGALSYSNDLSTDPAGVPAGEHPWTVSLLDATSVTGAWSFKDLSNGAKPPLWSMTAAHLELYEPQLVLNGMLWLATAPLTAADLLPSPDNWLADIQQIPLSTPQPDDALQSPFSFRFSSISLQRRPDPPNPEPMNSVRKPDQASQAVQLTDIAFSWQVNPATFTNSDGRKTTILDTLLTANKSPFKSGDVWQSKPLLWRSHPVLPLVQTLPLTQNQVPPNSPSASSQYAPFEFPSLQVAPYSWNFSTSGNAAAAWPRYSGTSLPPSADWTGTGTDSAYPSVIPMAALSLPGMIYDPSLTSPVIAASAHFLQPQYQAGLSYLDTINALSELPKADAEDSAQTPQTPVLLRSDYADYWKTLSEKAFLARTDSDDLFVSKNGKVEVTNLIEPFVWPVKVTLDDTQYPGKLTIDGGDIPMELSGDDALRGIHGSFRLDRTAQLVLTTPDAEQFKVVAGSLAAYKDNGNLSDQRGLRRGATSLTTGVNSVTLFTPAESMTHPNLALCTSLKPVDLHQSWQLWFRDLPVNPSGNVRVFDRSMTRSVAARGVNDPASIAVGQGELSGYEWRLGPAQEKLDLFGLQFIPLTLERAEFDLEGNLTRLAISGRLLPPWANANMEACRANAVRLQWEGSPLALTGLSPEGRDVDSLGNLPPQPSEHAGELPLGGEDSPRLLWDEIKLGDDKSSIVINPDSTKPGSLDFFFWGRRWLLDIGPIEFASGKITKVIAARPLQPGNAVQIDNVTLTIDQSQTASDAPVLLTARLLYHLGKDNELIIQANETVPVFGKFNDASGPQIFLCQHANNNFRQIAELQKVAPQTAASTLGAFQVTFSGVKTPADYTSLQLFPGMHLSQQEPISGFLTMAFDVNGFTPAPPAPGQAAALPPLAATAAFAELILSADWGEFLQESGQSQASIYGSSAGSLRCGYTISSAFDVAQNPSLQTQLLLNGFMEVKNLISWPIQKVADPNNFVIPAVQGAASLDHTRHTMRILLNQHEPVAELFAGGPDNCLFGFANLCGWQFLAVTEHQCVDVVNGVADNDRRWTTVQEVRLLTPGLFASYLKNSQENDYLTAQIKSDFLGVDIPELANRDASYLHRTLRDALIVDDLPGKMANALIVEASAIHWIKGVAEKPGRYSTVQYLPGTNLQATISVLADFDATLNDVGTDWRLLSLPFLGRLQPKSRDGINANPAAPQSALEVDPILALERAPAATIPQLLASWEDTAPRTVPIAQFDQSMQRRWSRLDPASLAESWFRLNATTPAPIDMSPLKVQSVVSVLKVQSMDPAGRLSLPSTLGQSYESWRGSLPPDHVVGPSVLIVGALDPLLWRRIGLFTLDGFVPDEAGDHRLYLVGALIAGSGLASPHAQTSRFPAASLIPPSLHVSDPKNPNGFNNPEPVTLCASPYIGLSMQRVSATGAVSLICGDLICLDLAGSKLIVVASQIWQGKDAGNADGQRLWATEVRDRLAPESRVAILRFRSIQPASTGDVNQPELATVNYTFDLLPYSGANALAELTQPLRSALARIRFKEGQLSGQEVPAGLVPFEAAPPQVRGVQPIYETHRPTSAPLVDPEDELWPWGLSALRFNIQTTESKDPSAPNKFQPYGVPGDPAFLWWHAASHFVQFEAGSVQSTHALPYLFRAPAIPSMLPTAPFAKLPVPSDDFQQPLPGDFQPLLPGAWDMIVSGARPGAPFVFRHQLLRQETGSPFFVASGSVPIQHRMTRPVPIPPTRTRIGPIPAQYKGVVPPEIDGRNFALQTWGSYFDWQQLPEGRPVTVSPTLNPTDTAFFAPEDAPPVALNVQLVSPWEPDPAPYFESGTIPPLWGGALKFRMTDGETGASPTGWKVSCSLQDGTSTVLADPVDTTLLFTVFHFQSNSLTSSFLAAKQHGDPITAVVWVERTDAQVKGYRQQLTFPLRVSRAGANPTPFMPYFVLFEDPEYTRALLSQTLRTQRMLVLSATDSQLPVTFALDRREYNPTSHVYLVYSIAQPPSELKLTIPALGIVPSILGKDGTPRRLNAGLTPPLADKTIFEFSIGGQGQVGETLLVHLVIPDAHDPANDIVIASLQASLVAEPVIPAVESAFALLRRRETESTSSVACVRYAWNPAATRIELVNPDDLLNRETVRRRAVFQWLDVVRKAGSYTYGIQKIAPGGSTHMVPLTK